MPAAHHRREDLPVLRSKHFTSAGSDRPTEKANWLCLCWSSCAFVTRVKLTQIFNQGHCVDIFLRKISSFSDFALKAKWDCRVSARVFLHSFLTTQMGQHDPNVTEGWRVQWAYFRISSMIWRRLHSSKLQNLNSYLKNVIPQAQLPKILNYEGYELVMKSRSNQNITSTCFKEEERIQLPPCLFSSSGLPQSSILSSWPTQYFIAPSFTHTGFLTILCGKTFHFPFPSRWQSQHTSLPIQQTATPPVGMVPANSFEGHHWQSTSPPHPSGADWPSTTPGTRPRGP